MFSSKCESCGHDNPATAKFCNECGAPVHLQHCIECDAINDRSAALCYKCGADLIAERADAVVEDSLESFPSDADFDFGPSTLGGRERRPPSAGARADPTDAVRHFARRGVAHVVTDVAEFIAHERPFRTVVTPSFSPPQRAAEIVTVSVRPPTAPGVVPRVALLGSLIAALAIGYFAYRGPAGNDAGQAARSDVNRPVAVGLAAAPSGVDTPDATASMWSPATPAETHGKIRVSSAKQSENEKNLPPDGSASAPLSPNASAARSTAAPMLAKSVDSAPKQRAVAKTESREPFGAASNRRAIAAPSPPIPTASSFPDADKLVVRARAKTNRGETSIAVGQVRPCVEQVAALGLCSRHPDKDRP